MGAENAIGDPRGQRLAGLGGARLHHDRASLRRAQYIQRPPHLEMRASMIEEPHLRGVEALSGRLVVDHRAIGPAIPQARHDVEEFVGPVVAVIVLHVAVEAEILGLGFRLGGDEVPAAAPAADLIQCREASGDVVGLVIGRRSGGDEPDARGDGGERGQERHRLETGRAAMDFAGSGVALRKQIDRLDRTESAKKIASIFACSALRATSTKTSNLLSVPTTASGIRQPPGCEPGGNQNAHSFILVPVGAMSLSCSSGLESSTAPRL